MRFSRVQAVKMLTGRGEAHELSRRLTPALQDLRGVCGEVRRGVSECPGELSKAGVGGALSWGV